MVRWFVHKSRGSCVLLIALLLVGCAEDRRNEVVVMGMIHGNHRTSESYGVEVIRQWVRDIDPDYILCEIPPDRLGTALAEYEKTGRISESRVSRFPEYVDAIIPLMDELHFELIPCAAWTQAMADDRRAKLQDYQTERPDDYAEMERADQIADDLLQREGLSEDPRKIHTARYDEIVREGLEPYNRLLNDDLGLGGWDNINRAHFALIAAALDRHRGERKLFLITFGAGHKHWFLDRLRERNDIILRNPTEFMHP
jgi:hypothetical protein